MQNSILLPLLIPFLTAVLAIVFRNKAAAQRLISLTGSAMLLGIAAWLLVQVEQHDYLSLQVGSWKVPYGITLVVDMFSALMLLVSAVVGLLVNIFALQNVDQNRLKYGFHVFYQFLIMGVNGAFIAGDVFNLYVWFEIMLIASFAMLSLGNTQEQLIGNLKYLLLSFLASSFLLVGIGMIYGLSGSLNMADVALFFQENSDNPLITVAAVLFILPFGIKSALFPLYFWLPASYPFPPISISAVFSGLLTKVGVYALIRFFTLIFIHDINYTHFILLVLSAFTMLSGVLGAVSQNSMRKILSFHIISQIGYMVMGLAFYTPLAIAGSIFYIIHHIIVKTNLFLIAGVVEQIKGSSVLKNVGGLYKNFPMLSLLFMIPALSLAGLPPLSGFWAKFVLLKAGLQIEAYTMVLIALITGLLTLFSMTKIWNQAFWEKDTKASDKTEMTERQLFGRFPALLVPVVIMAFITLFIGLYSEPLMQYSTIAAEQLMNPQRYIEFVMTQ